MIYMFSSGVILNFVILYSVTYLIKSQEDDCQRYRNCRCIPVWKGNTTRFYTCSDGYKLTGYASKSLPPPAGQNEEHSKNVTDECDYSLDRPGNNHVLVSKDRKTISLNCSEGETKQFYRSFMYCEKNGTHWNGFIPICQKTNDTSNSSGSSAIIVVLCIIAVILATAVTILVGYMYRKIKRKGSSAVAKTTETFEQMPPSDALTKTPSTNTVSKLDDSLNSNDLDEIPCNGNYVTIDKQFTNFNSDILPKEVECPKDEQLVPDRTDTDHEAPIGEPLQSTYAHIVQYQSKASCFTVNDTYSHIQQVNIVAERNETSDEGASNYDKMQTKYSRNCHKAYQDAEANEDFDTYSHLKYGVKDQPKKQEVDSRNLSTNDDRGTSSSADRDDYAKVVKCLRSKKFELDKKTTDIV